MPPQVSLGTRKVLPRNKVHAVEAATEGRPQSRERPASTQALMPPVTFLTSV
jgi:hypothetical protein